MMHVMTYPPPVVALTVTSSTLHQSYSHDSLDHKASIHTACTISSASSLDECEHDEKSADKDTPNDIYSFPPGVAQRLVDVTVKRVSQILAKSPFIQKYSRLHDLPRFEREDLQIGQIIASGGFSNVHALEGFTTSTYGDFVDTDFANANSPNRTRCWSNQYVIKSLNPKLVDNPKKLVGGARDLVMEAHVLSSLCHPHILQLKGWCAAGVSGFTETGRADGFFLILERLPETLGQRINTWKKEKKATRARASTIVGVVNPHKSRCTMQFMERLQVSIDIADAISYLHSKRIVYRDLKPANIGFDQDGRVKLFDFGLAIELPSDELGITTTAATRSRSDPSSCVTFELPGNTGTARYMAVEVIRKQPYNCKVDVFSFSVLLWELMALCKPYNGLDGQKVKERVSILGERPVIPWGWPYDLRRILTRGWAESLVDRPHMDEVKSVLEKMLEASAKSCRRFVK